MKEHHETLVHVILLMAVEQCGSWVIGGELDMEFSFGFDEHYIFEYAVSVWVLRKTAQFEAVAMQMDRVVVAAGVPELKPVALAMHERCGAGFWPGFAVDRPVVGRAVSREFRFKDERYVDYVSGR